MASNKYKYLIKNTALRALSGFGSKVLSFFLIRFYTSYLTQGEYGIATNITETANLLIPILSLSIADAVYRFAMDEKYSQKQILSSGLATWGFCIIFSLLCLPVLSLVDFLKGYEWLVVAYVLASVLHTVTSEYVHGKGFFGLSAIHGIFNTLVMLCLNIVFLVFMHMRIEGFVLSTIIADLSATGFLFVGAKLYKEVDFRTIRLQTMKRMLIYSIPLIPAAICWWITNVSDRYVITAFIGEQATGLYAAANKIPSLMMVLAGIFINAWKNSATIEASSKDSYEFYTNVFDAFSGICLLASSGIIAFTKLLTVILLDADYFEAWRFIPILTIAMIFFNYNSFFGSIYVVTKKSSLSFYTSIVGAVLNVGLNLWIVNTSLGALGAAVTTVISYLVIFVLRIFTTKDMIKFNKNYKKMILGLLTVALQAVFLILELPFAYVVQAIGVFVILALYGVRLAKMLPKLLKR